ncbi:Rqc2 family fibronectin-binding protein [Lutispora thermophila]|mgnify:CR=1 FL=1|uniref:Rqc2 homolog RqcH n=1 Tax=Lutispora thermophila DSM 19022 TaxID=1122184 RepID=A0A1M6G2I2_9FIRM|nr:NFACT RNA binding domain-containing protein [Lutispora thermophila]SHJ04198.1 Predicted component of the ribosome quality control (RQC) complex, YloA/Tae2 family, contains fibronectin-binding (FbpA) and DUF814 domains [Lutispora thermophila DSM 19022]
MPFDGITVNSLIWELNNTILDGKVEKIYQPEKDEININIRNNKTNHKLVISASSMYPKMHLSEISKTNPVVAPAFCMLLRKHLTSSRIISIKQPSLERIIEITFNCMDEMGYSIEKSLIIEIMGRNSNIIFVDSNSRTIIDSIKRVGNDMSSVRTILPGFKYVYPPSSDKKDPLTINDEYFISAIKSESGSIKAHKYLVKTFYGISPIIAQEICLRAGIDSDNDIKELSIDEIKKLFSHFHSLMEEVKNGKFSPNIVKENSKNIDFSPVELSIYDCYKKIKCDSISKVIEEFYYQKDLQDRIKQKTSDLSKIVKTKLERNEKKLSILENELSEAENSEYYRLCGDIIMANLYRLEKGQDKAILPNFYDENYADIEIKLDPRLSPSDNAQKYYKQYNKSKAAQSFIKEQINQVLDEIVYLESIQDSLSKNLDEHEINEIRQELIQEGYIKSNKENMKNLKNSNRPSKPMHYVSSSGFDIYVGKNNTQNDYLTLKFASSDDIWLHTKDIPGSHVILKTDGKQPDDDTLKEAASLAAYYSKGRLSSNVAVDYTFKKNVKKPSGAKPGKVIYEKHKTIYITPDENMVNNIKKSGQ